MAVKRADSQVLKGLRHEQPVGGLLDAQASQWPAAWKLSGALDAGSFTCMCCTRACDVLGFVCLSECLLMVSVELDCGKRAMTL